MKFNIKKSLFAEYPIPEVASVWGGDGISTFPLFDFDALLATCIREIASDVFIKDYVRGTAIKTYLPADTIAVTSAKMDYPFQGNRSVKFQYNPSDHSVVTRFPNVIYTIRRRLSPKNIDKLVGDKLIYFKSYVLAQMAEKEIETLTAVELQADNGNFTLEKLSACADKWRARYEAMKQDITFYAVGV